jgi:hypothetical protein
MKINHPRHQHLAPVCCQCVASVLLMKINHPRHQHLVPVEEAALSLAAGEYAVTLGLLGANGVV